MSVAHQQLYASGTLPVKRIEEILQAQGTVSDGLLTIESTATTIDAMLAHGLVLQAEHQHFYDLRPMVFFMHFRAVGDPIRLAKALAAVVNVTGTPLPQKMPPHPTTPLDVGAIDRILGGPATVGADGVVSVGVPRRDTIVLGAVPVRPELNVLTTVAFEPLGGGQHAVAVARKIRRGLDLTNSTH